MPCFACSWCIGLSSDDRYGWQWADGESPPRFSYANWKDEATPNPYATEKKCAAISPAGSWDETSCDSCGKTGYVCKKGT